MQSFHALIEAALDVDACQTDEAITRKIEKTALRFIDAEAVQFFYCQEDPMSLYRPLSKKGQAAEYFQNTIGLLSEAMSTRRRLLANAKQLEALEDCAIKKRIDITNAYIVPIHDAKKGYGLLAAFNVKKEAAPYESFEHFAALLTLVLRRHSLQAKDVHQKPNKSIIELSQFLFRTRRLSGFYDKVIQLLHEQMKAERLSIILKKADLSAYCFEAGRGINPHVLLHGKVTIQDNPLAWVRQYQEGILCNDIEADKRFPRNKRLRYTQKAFMVLPLMHLQEVIGFLCVTDKSSKKPFSKEEFDYVKRIAKTVEQGIIFWHANHASRPAGDTQDTGHVSPALTEADDPKMRVTSVIEPPLITNVFTERYREWLQKQKDFYFSEYTYNATSRRLFVNMNHKSLQSYLLSVGCLTGDAANLLKYEDSTEAFLSYAVEQNLRAKEAYRFFRREYCRLIGDKEAFGLQLSLWALSKEKKNLLSYVATQDYGCLYANSRTREVDFIHMDNELLIDYMDTRIREKLIYTHRDDVLFIYSTQPQLSLSDEKIRHHLQTLLSKYYDKRVQEIHDALWDTYAEYFDKGNGFYLFKMR